MRWLKSSLPKIVPTPSAVWVTNNEMNAANISGEDAAAAMKVAPATSSGILYLVQNWRKEKQKGLYHFNINARSCRRVISCAEGGRKKSTQTAREHNEKANAIFYVKTNRVQRWHEEFLDHSCEAIEHSETCEDKDDPPAIFDPSGHNIIRAPIGSSLCGQQGQNHHRRLKNDHPRAHAYERSHSPRV